MVDVTLLLLNTNYPKSALLNSPSILGIIFEGNKKELYML